MVIAGIHLNPSPNFGVTTSYVLVDLLLSSSPFLPSFPTFLDLIPEILPDVENAW